MDAKTILEAWQKTMIEKSDCLSQYLAERFHDSIFGKRWGNSISFRASGMVCFRRTPVLGDINILSENNGICVGTHTAKFPDENGSDVMFFGKISERKATE